MIWLDKFGDLLLGIQRTLAYGAVTILVNRFATVVLGVQHLYAPLHYCATKSESVANSVNLFDASLSSFF